ncbi:hypothetical protein HPB47_025453 [Ixodes persulcatus]|uniref:Uncharacterized protein n=1 Tax=Ixodes persulcatus TaxID=34615 RepID=A0AC60Q2Q0_IXOPE|nr:hypothetical protein HPB47_025453 [Ixodes persulcatus]
MGNQGTLGPPILNPAGSISANSEIEEMESALDNWQVSRNKRRRKRATTPAENLDVKASDETKEKTKGQASTQTVVLKPICREDVKTFGSREIKNAVEKAGITCGEEYRIQIQPKTNTIAITTRNEQTTEKLLKITELNKKDKAYALRPYKAMGNNLSRGVIYLNEDASEETPNTLLTDLECRTAKVVYARLMGKDSNAVVITFEGTRLPKKVVFSRQIFNVKPYRPRPIVCYNCHGLGQMTDVCPCHERRCGCCGYIHEEDMEDCKRQPQCRNCNGPHVATSKDCPKRKIPGKKASQPREPLRPQGTSYADAIKVVDSTQSTVQVNSCDPSGSQERASTNWVPDWAKIIANENKPKPQPQLTETKEKDTARVDEREKFPIEKKGWAAVGVLRHIPQAQLDTSKLCSEEKEVVAVRLKNGKQRLVVASIYIRPKAKPEEGETKRWIRELLKLADKDQLVVGGDFNAQHRDWGYRINTRKGRDIAEAMEEIGLTLRNESGVKTRLAKQARQHDTTPDLTWASKSLPLRWTPWRDNLGSDHYPIDVTVEQHKDGRIKEARPIIRCDHFREILLQNLDGKNSIEASNQQAM